MSASATTDLAASLQARFPSLTVRPSADVPAFNIPAAHVLEVLAHLRDQCGFDVLSDLTAVDWAAGASPRFTVVYHLLATERAEYVRLASDCPGGDEPTMPTATGLWPGADWHERECFDLMGVKFTGHPDLRRILMWDGYPHHPLRKDFPLAGVEGELPAADVAEEVGPVVKPAPMAGGPFVSKCGGTLASGEPRALDQSWNESNPKSGNAEKLKS